MKRVLSTLLVFAMLLAFVPAELAFATETSDYGDFFDFVDTDKEDDREERPPSDYDDGSDDAPASGVQTGLKEDKVLADWSKFRDVSDHWATTTLKWAVDNGLMCGRTSTMMEPNGTITRAEMVTMITRAFGAYQREDISFFVDVERGSWYYDEFQRIVAMGVFVGYGNAVKPNEEVTRQEVATLLVRAAGFVLQPQSYLYRFSDYKATDVKKADYLATAIYHDIIRGYPDGTCRPNGKITRAEFAVMLNRLAAVLVNNVTTSSVRNTGDSMLVGTGVVGIHDIYINKNLFLSDGVSTDTITLTNVTVRDTLYVRGAGNIVIDGKSVVSNIVLCNPHTAVTLVIGKDAAVSNVYVHDGIGGVSIKGKIGTLSINVPEVPVRLDDAEVASVILASPFCGLRATKNTKICELFISADARGAVAELLGKVTSLGIAAEDCNVTVSNEVGELTIYPGADGLALNVKETANISEILSKVDGLRLSFGGTIRDLQITGSNNKLTFAKDTKVYKASVKGEGNAISVGDNSLIESLSVTGDRNTVTAPNAEIEEFTFTGNDCKLNWSEGTADSLVFSGHDGVVSLGANTDIRTIELGGSEISLNAVGTIKYLVADVDELRATVDGFVDEMTVYGRDVSMTVGADSNKVTIEAIGSVVEFTGEYTNIYLKGAENTIKFTGKCYYMIASGRTYYINCTGEIDALGISGSDYRVVERGIKQVVVSWGNDISIMVAGAVVVNNGANTIYAGGEAVEPGKTVRISASGSGLEKDPEEEGKEEGEGEEGGSGSGGDTGKPAEPTVVEFQLALIERGSASDIFPENTAPLTSFTSGISYNATTGELTGTVLYLDNFVAYPSGSAGATGYYVPLYITSTQTYEGATLTIGGVTFGVEAISSGMNTRGKWCVPVYLDYFNTDPKIEIVYDADGAGTDYAPATVVVDYSGVTFVGGPAANASYERASALPGIDGAETAGLSITKMDGGAVYVYSLTTSCLLETRNAAGRYGYWTGLKMGAPAGAAYAKFNISSPDGTTALIELKVSDGFVGWQVNAACATETVKEVIASVTWYNANNELIRDMSKTIVLNLAGVVKAGDVIGAPPVVPEEPETPVSIVTDFMLSGVEEDACIRAFGRSITTFAIGYRISGNAISGTFVEKDGVYYIPVKITGTASEPAVIYYENQSMAIVSEAGEFTRYILIPAETAVDTLRDFKVHVKPVEMTSKAVPYEVKIDCSFAHYTDAAIVVNDVIPSGTVDGKSLSELISMPEYDVFWNTLTVSGAVNKIAKHIYYDGVTRDMWLVPVEFLVLTPDSNWRIEIKAGDDVLAVFSSANINTAGSLVVLVPLAVNGVAFSSITVTMYNTTSGLENAVMGTVVVYNDATMVGIN